MPKAIYVNLVVEDLQRAMTFFRSLGFFFNEEFTNDEAAALVISETIFAMLHTPDSLRRFTNKELVNARTATEVLLALEFGSRAEVDALLSSALTAGAKEQREAKDHGFMYERAFEDPDGHIWEAFCMTPTPSEAERTTSNP